MRRAELCLNASLCGTKEEKSDIKIDAKLTVFREVIADKILVGQRLESSTLYRMHERVMRNRPRNQESQLDDLRPRKNEEKHSTLMSRPSELE